MANDYADSGEPTFDYRDMFIGNAGHETLWYVRNRVNGDSTFTSQEYGGEIAYGGPSMVHTFYLFFPAYYGDTSSEYWQAWRDIVNPDHESYFETHPEWYAWSNAVAGGGNGDL